MPGLTLFRKTFLIIFLVELLSLTGYFFGLFNPVFFIILALIFLLVSLRSLAWGLTVLSAELFIGSKGYLFYLEAGGFQVSIRLMFFLILISVWLYLLAKKILAKEISAAAIAKTREEKTLLVLLALLFFAILAGAANGLLRGRAFDSLFFDLNGWLFFALAWPLLSLPAIFGEEALKLKKIILPVFLAATAWLSVKTLALLYLFSHLGPYLTDIYRWVRESGVGEITMMPGNFYRIFIQSQIFVLAAVFVVLALIAKRPKKGVFHLYLLLGLFLAATLTGMSRSNWLGLALALGLFFAGHSYACFRPFRDYFNYWLRLAGVGLISVFLVFALVKFPWPSPDFSVNAIESLRDRTGNIDSEAGAASRWALLPAMLSEIKASPLIGHGFGKTLSYKTSDPRALENNPSGLYTTYAFEWGWLDVWLKLGIAGLLAYAAIFGFMIAAALRRFIAGKDPAFLLAASLLLLLAAVNFFSPYLNHPLGIGYLLLLIFYYFCHPGSAKC